MDTDPSVTFPPVRRIRRTRRLWITAQEARALEAAVAKAGLGVRHYHVPGRPHFYDRESPVQLQGSTMPGGEHCGHVEAAIEQFLADALTPATVSVDRLESFADAWSRHDIEALMACMSDDCVFHASAGPEASGTRHVGRDAVRAGFIKAWADFPDAQWTRARHFVAGRRGVSEWTFVGTRASDGQRVEVDGCDVFTFHGDKIRVGYYSSDFREHATSYLMAEVLEAHNRQRFELYAFSFGPPADDDMRARIASAPAALRCARRRTWASIRACRRWCGPAIAMARASRSGTAPTSR